jgi:hypothetical protein
MMIDPLNECAFLTTGYNFMRLEYCFWKTPTLSRKFLESFSDKELWSFYLDKLVKLPQFGKGQYQCADIDPETGLKKD